MVRRIHERKEIENTADITSFLTTMIDAAWLNALDVDFVRAYISFRISGQNLSGSTGTDQIRLTYIDLTPDRMKARIPTFQILADELNTMTDIQVSKEMQLSTAFTLEYLT